METHAQRYQGSVMGITYKVEIASLVDLPSIWSVENVLIKIVSLMVPMNYVPHVEMDSGSTLTEIANFLIQTVSLSTTEDVMSVVKDGTPVQGETASDSQPTVSSVMSSPKDLALSVLMDLLSNPMVHVPQSLQPLHFQIVQLFKEMLAKLAIQVSSSETVDAAKFQAFAMDQILQMEPVEDALQDTL